MSAWDHYKAKIPGLASLLHILGAHGQDYIRVLVRAQEGANDYPAIGHNHPEAAVQPGLQLLPARRQLLGRDKMFIVVLRIIAGTLKVQR